MQTNEVIFVLLLSGSHGPADAGLIAGATVGGIVGVLIIVAVIVLVVLLLRRRQRFDHSLCILGLTYVSLLLLTEHSIFFIFLSAC